MLTTIGDPVAAEAIMQEIARTEQGRVVSCDRLVRVALQAARRIIGGDGGNANDIDGRLPGGF